MRPPGPLRVDDSQVGGPARARRGSRESACPTGIDPGGSLGDAFVRERETRGVPRGSRGPPRRRCDRPPSIGRPRWPGATTVGSSGSSGGSSRSIDRSRRRGSDIPASWAAPPSPSTRRHPSRAARSIPPEPRSRSSRVMAPSVALNDSVAGADRDRSRRGHCRRWLRASPPGRAAALLTDGRRLASPDRAPLRRPAGQAPGAASAPPTSSTEAGNPSVARPIAGARIADNSRAAVTAPARPPSRRRNRGR